MDALTIQRRAPGRAFPDQVNGLSPSNDFMALPSLFYMLLGELCYTSCPLVRLSDAWGCCAAVQAALPTSMCMWDDYLS